MKRYKLLIVIFALQTSGLVAMATARNDIWQTAVPMSSSPAATTFRSTSTYHSRQQTATHYTPSYRSGNAVSSSARANASYKTSSGVSCKAYQSSGATVHTYGGSYWSTSGNGAYTGSRTYNRYSGIVSSTFPIAGGTVAKPKLVDNPATLAHYTAASDNPYSWRGDPAPADPDLGDSYTDDFGKSWTWNGEEWISTAAEPVPAGDLPIVLLIAFAAIYCITKRRKAQQSVE